MDPLSIYEEIYSHYSHVTKEECILSQISYQIMFRTKL